MSLVTHVLNPLIERMGPERRGATVVCGDPEGRLSLRIGE